MTSPRLLEELALDQLAACAADQLGFSLEAVPREALRRLLEGEVARGQPVEAVLRRALDGEPEMHAALRRALTVGETYLFRQAEHFQMIVEEIVPALLAAGRTRLVAWSAGCSTGEEAYSLAAALRAAIPADRAITVDVLGTDVFEPALATAAQALYGPGSQRVAGPLLYPVLRPVGRARPEGRRAILEELRAITRFAPHDLRTPAPGRFDVILCRNVLVYFSPPAAAATLAHLAQALEPGGILLLGAMDVDGRVDGLARIGPPERQAFLKPVPAPAPRPRAPGVPAPRAAAPPAVRPSDPLERHTEALRAIEAKETRRAEQILAGLNQEHPDYLPAVMERALLHSRNGERTAAVEWMRELLRRAEHLTPSEDTRLLGPEGLPLGFFVRSARAFLRTQGEPE